MSFEVRAEVPDDREMVRTLVRFEAPTYSQVWLEAERMKAMGWRILSAPARVEFPEFPLEHAA